MYRRVFGDHDTVPRFLTTQAERHGDKPLLSFPRDGTAISYRSLADSSETASTRLHQIYGLAAGTFAAIFLPNGEDFIRSWFACLFGGIVDVPINHEFRKTSLLHCLATAQVQVIFTDAVGLAALCDPEVIAYLERVRLIVLAGPVVAAAASEKLNTMQRPPALLTLSELCAPGPKQRIWAPLLGSALASIRYTSGTTGLAKGIMQSHLHMLNKSAVHSQFMAFSDTDILYSPFPLHHNLASINGLLGIMQAGGTMVSVTRFSASAYWDEIRSSDATVGHVLAPLIPLLLKQAPHSDDAQHRCRLLWTAWPHHEFERRFGVQLLQTYAISEVGAVSHRIGNPVDGGRATGVPIPEMEIRLVDALDRPQAPGVAGEITIRPREPHRVMLGYINNLPATIRAFQNLWFHTGDEGFIDDAGQLHFIGRIGDSIRRRGVNISPEQIESELGRHGNVLECAVFGVPSDLGEDDIYAVLKWREPPHNQTVALVSLVTFLKDRLPRQYVPRFFEVIDEMPKTSTGKIQKNLLRARKSPPSCWDRDARRP